MYKAVFQNSKIALAFAAMTVISAVSMVGTSEDGGVVGKVTTIVEARRDSIASKAQADAETQNVGGQPGGSGEGSVFGDYAPGVPDVAASGAADPAQPSAVPSISEREMTIEPE